MNANTVAISVQALPSSYLHKLSSAHVSQRGSSLSRNIPDLCVPKPSTPTQNMCMIVHLGYTYIVVSHGFNSVSLVLMAPGWGHEEVMAVQWERISACALEPGWLGAIQAPSLSFDPRKLGTSSGKQKWQNRPYRLLELNDITDVKNHLVHLKGGGIYDWMKTSMIYATHVFIYIMIISHTYISSALYYSFFSYFAVPHGRNCLKNQQYEKKVVFKFHFIISCPEYMTKLQRWYQIFKNIWWNTA